MSTPNWVDYRTDRCYGDSDPDGNTDTFNRAVKEIWGNFTAYDTAPAGGTGEHDRDGDHMSDLSTGLWSQEEGTYTGNGADDRNISLADSGLDIKFIRVWDAAVINTFLRSEDMAGDATLDYGTGFVADYIQSVATTGQFQVGTTLNVNLREYYYIINGVS
jgi:hypothetical protein